MDSLVDTINDFLEVRSKGETDAYVKSAISPTDGGKCIRQLWYRFMESKPEFAYIGELSEPLNAKTLRIFAVGNALHEMIQTWFSDMGILIKDEQRINTKYRTVPVHAYIDAILLFNDSIIPVEIKSIKSWGFKKLPPGGKPEHIVQLQMYLHFTNLSQGYLLYIDKDSNDLKEILVAYDENLIVEELDKLVNAWECVNSKLIPDPPYKGKSKYPCSYCSYRNLCYKDR